MVAVDLWRAPHGQSLKEIQCGTENHSSASHKESNPANKYVGDFRSTYSPLDHSHDTTVPADTMTEVLSET